jgi:hypothetical protein
MTVIMKGAGRSRIAVLGRAEGAAADEARGAAAEGPPI